MRDIASRDAQIAQIKSEILSLRVEKDRMAVQLTDMTVEIQHLCNDFSKLQEEYKNVLDPTGHGRSYLLEEIRSQVRLGVQRRDDHHLKSVFNTFAISNTVKGHLVDLLPPNEFAFALKALNVGSEDDLHAERLFAEMDMNNDEGLDFDEFKAAVETPSTLEKWTRSLPLAQLLADTFPMSTMGGDSLGKLSTLSTAVLDAVCIGFAEGLKYLLSEKINELKQALLVMNAKSSGSNDVLKGKFQVDQLSCGKIENFYGGLRDRIGTPHLDFEVSMMAEHCQKAGCDVPFKSFNYDIETTPEEEWKIIVEGKATSHMGHGRTIRELKALMAEEVVVCSNISRDEVIAVVLYTGPMYQVYNTILRRWPAQIYEAFENGGNLFTTTIFVLASAVQKIAHAMKLPENVILYRGLGGTKDLPSCFYKSDARGCKGYTEWGFTSTTSRKEVALQYSGVREGRANPAILVIHTSAVDRGACISSLSQYPVEVEYLYVPCSFFSPCGPRHLEVAQEGVVVMIPVRIHANLKTLTLSELLSEKKERHLASFRFSLDELRHELSTAPAKYDIAQRLKDEACSISDFEDFTGGIMTDCEEVFCRHQDAGLGDYVEFESYSRLVIEMMETRKFGKSKLMCWVSNPDFSLRFVSEQTLRDAAWWRIEKLKQKIPSLEGDEVAETALECLRQCGLVRESVDETDENGKALILTAADDGWNESNLRLLVLAAADVNARDPTHGSTPLMFAAQNGHTGTVQALVSLGADVNSVNGEFLDYTALLFAVGEHKTSTARLLVSLGADIHAAASNGETAVSIAREKGFDDTLSALIDLGARP